MQEKMKIKIAKVSEKIVCVLSNPEYFNNNKLERIGKKEWVRRSIHNLVMEGIREGRGIK